MAKNAVGVIVVLEQDLAGLTTARLPVGEQPIQLGRGQPREQSLAAFDGWRYVGDSGRSCMLSSLLDHWAGSNGDSHGEALRAHRGGDGREASGRAKVRGVREGGGRWVHLRTCQSCGATLCCDSSPGKHASKHAATSGHPVIASGEPGRALAATAIPDDAFAEAPSCGATPLSCALAHIGYHGGMHSPAGASAFARDESHAD